jgi:tetratricopeptide (TPR) repeat protein
MAKVHAAKIGLRFRGTLPCPARVERRAILAASARFRAIALGCCIALQTLGLVNVGGLNERVALAQSMSGSQSPSWFDSMTSGIKQGFAKIGNFFNPKSSNLSKPEDSAIALNGQGKPDANLYVAVAHLQEGSNHLAEAEQQYQLALKDKPNHLPALMGYAQLKDRLGKPDEAIRLYQQAAKAHPKEAAVYNNMGLCYARYRQLKEAAAALGQAVQLEPRNVLYRNNLATVLVDQGRLAEAVERLRPVHGPAQAYYNVGYLLNSKGQPHVALQYFALALQADPSLTPARQWFDHLQQQSSQAHLARPADAGVTVARPTAAAPAEPPMVTQEPLRVSQTPAPPAVPRTQRLPPTNAYGAGAAAPSDPFGRSSSGGGNIAPLPPTLGSRASGDASSELR